MFLLNNPNVFFSFTANFYQYNCPIKCIVCEYLEHLFLMNKKK